MITKDGIEEITQSILDLVSHGTYVLNGKLCLKELYKATRENNKIFIYLYFDDEVSGSIQEFNLISKSGHVFAAKPEKIEKLNTRGLLIRFGFEIREEVNDGSIHKNSVG